MAVFHSNRDAAKNLIGGLKKLGECDFTSLTPTDITSTGTTTVDGFDFNVTTLAAATTIRIDSNGLYLTGGTGACDWDMNLLNFDGTFNGRSKQMVGFSCEVSEVGDTSQWLVGFGTSWSDLIDGIRSGSNAWQWQRRRGGVASWTGNTINNGITSFGMTANAGGTGRYRTGALTGVALDPIIDHGGIGSCGPADMANWYPFPDGGGIFKFWFSGANARDDIKIKRVSLWALRDEG